MWGIARCILRGVSSNSRYKDQMKISLGVPLTENNKNVSVVGNTVWLTTVVSRRNNLLGNERAEGGGRVPC